MKNLKEIKKEIQDTIKSSEGLVKTETTYKNLQKRAILLNDVRLYLEGEPTEDFCKSELERLTSLKGRIEAADLKNYSPPKKVNEVDWSKKKSAYRAEMDYSTIVSQIKTLKFILS